MTKIHTTFVSNLSRLKPTVWKRYIADVFSLWDIGKADIETFIEEANIHRPTIKFTAEISYTETVFLDTIVYKDMRFKDQSIKIKMTAEISYTETVFLDTKVYKDTRFKDQSILDVKAYFKPTETFQYTHFTSCHPPSRKKWICQRRGLTNCYNKLPDTFEENISKFKKKNCRTEVTHAIW